MIVETPKCMVCGNGGIIEVVEDEWYNYRMGEKIQIALSNDDDEREQILTGTHGECFNNIFCTCGTGEECEVHS